MTNDEHQARQRAYDLQMANRMIRKATNNDLDKTRTRVQTRFRRTLKQLDPTVKADGKAKSVIVGASKERVKGTDKPPIAYKSESQGANNVIGSRNRLEIIDPPRGLGGVYN